MKEPTTAKQTRVSAIQSKTGECLVEEKKILVDSWTEYCSELYNHTESGDPTVLSWPQSMEEVDTLPIPRDEVEAEWTTSQQSLCKQGEKP